MRRLALVALFLLVAGPAAAQAGVLDRAAAGLRSDPVFVDPGAERADDVDADQLRDRIRDADW